jgi:ketosteroid isomerase-like protein
MLTEADARRFSDSWYAAWNRHDLDAIMAHYADGIEHSSPFIARYNADPECRPLKGKAAVRDYFGRALQRNPTLRFDPMHVGVGVETVALVYRRMTGEVAVETFRMRRGLVEASISHYGV